MKSIFETEINVPQAKLAEFYADPENNIKWMADLERCELICGKLGMPGSQYWLVPKNGKRVFVVTVILRDLPNELKLHLESASVNVLVTAKFIALSADKTKFISEEIFTFNGWRNKISGFLAMPLVRQAHHKHMNDFKRVVMSRYG